MNELPLGFKFAGVSCGIKESANSKDVALIVSDSDCTAAGVFTQNAVVAAPVLLCRKITPTSKARAVIINSGNANACTGEQGMLDAERMLEVTRQAIAADDSADVFVMSTGIIGHKLPIGKIESGIAEAAATLAATNEHFDDCVAGISTTDAFPKKLVSRIPLSSGKIRIAGMAKGAGMIGPNMATMLGILCTDVKLSPQQCQLILDTAVKQSFNCVSVEGHTSTNDSVVLLASGQSGIEPSDSDMVTLQNEVNRICTALAKMIVADGEGASHTIEIHVTGGQNDEQSDHIARTIAMSNLVKTAITGNDPNWGRIVSAAGFGDTTLDQNKIRLSINEIALFADGEPLDFDEKMVSKSMESSKEVLIEIGIGDGPGKATHWTSDLTTQYVEFNSEYST